MVSVLTFLRKMRKISRKGTNWIEGGISVQVKKNARFIPLKPAEAEGIHDSILCGNVWSAQGLFTSCADRAVVRRDIFLKEKSQAVENGAVPKSVAQLFGGFGFFRMGWFGAGWQS